MTRTLQEWHRQYAKLTKSYNPARVRIVLRRPASDRSSELDFSEPAAIDHFLSAPIDGQYFGGERLQLFIVVDVIIEIDGKPKLLTNGNE